jgi:polyisoprenoid-binding protein YceI
MLAISLAISIPAMAAAPAYKLIKEKSSLKFYAINNGVPVEGQFKDFSATINFDRDKPEASKILVEVSTASVSTDYDEVAKNLMSKDWLATSDFPKAMFTSKSVSRMPSSENYYSDGELKLRDKTVPVVLNFQLQFPDNKTAIANGYITIRRNDFGVGQGQWAKDDVVKNEVRVEFRVVAEKI